MGPKEIASTAARSASDKQAANVVVLDVSGPFGLADYFVIASVHNERQAKTVVAEVERVLRDEADVRPIRREGEIGGGWSLLDYGDVVVHVFSDEQRDFYDLERLWRDAPKVDWDQAASPVR